MTRIDDPNLAFVLEQNRYSQDSRWGYCGFNVEVTATVDLPTRIAGRGRNAIQRLSECLEPGLDGLYTEPMTAEEVADSLDRRPRRSGSRTTAPSMSINTAPKTLRWPVREEWYLGVDVGFSTARESLGYCFVRLFPSPNGATVEICTEDSQTVRHDRRARVTYLDRFLKNLHAALAGGVPLDGIGIDGPLTPDARPVAVAPSSYRPCERLLLQGSVPNAVRGQGFLLPVGQLLYGGAMAIRDVLAAHGAGLYVGGTLPPKFIVEAFPKLFLGLLRDPQTCGSSWFREKGIPRNRRDEIMARECFRRSSGGIPVVRARLEAAGLSIAEAGLETVLADHDLAAAFVSALTPILLRTNLGAYVGDPAAGGFGVPAPWLWATDWPARIGAALSRVPEVSYELP